MADAINGCNKPRIEIKTLTQEVSKNSDEILETLMNEGWEVLHISSTSVNVPYADRLGGWRIQHIEIIKLKRMAQIDGGGEVAEAKAMAEELNRLYANGDTRPPQPPTSRITVLGVDAEHPLIVERKPVEEVTYQEALASFKYTAEEISEIANRENREHLLKYVTMERQEWGGRSWDSLVNHLPPRPLSFAKCSPRVIDGVAT